jgi:hypothetical protein
MLGFTKQVIQIISVVILLNIFLSFVGDLYTDPSY